MLGGLLALVVRTIVRVFLQMYMDCLEKRCVLMIEGYFLSICGVVGVSWDVVGGDDVRVVD